MVKHLTLDSWVVLLNLDTFTSNSPKHLCCAHFDEIIGFNSVHLVLRNKQKKLHLLQSVLIKSHSKGGNTKFRRLTSPKESQWSRDWRERICCGRSRNRQDRKTSHTTWTGPIPTTYIRITHKSLQQTASVDRQWVQFYCGRKVGGSKLKFRKLRFLSNTGQFLDLLSIVGEIFLS